VTRAGHRDGLGLGQGSTRALDNPGKVQKSEPGLTLFSAQKPKGCTQKNILIFFIIFNILLLSFVFKIRISGIAVLVY